MQTVYCTYWKQCRHRAHNRSSHRSHVTRCRDQRQTADCRNDCCLWLLHTDIDSGRPTGVQKDTHRDQHQTADCHSDCCLTATYRKIHTDTHTDRQTLVGICIKKWQLSTKTESCFHLISSIIVVFNQLQWCQPDNCKIREISIDN